MERKASAVWQKDLKAGSGTVSTSSGALSNAQYTFSTRFENQAGTNPEELIAAAHAACFSMALAGQLSKQGMTPDRVTTTATVNLEKMDDQWTVTDIELDTVGFVPEADQAKFEAAANDAKENCPISRLLKAAITLKTKLEQRKYAA